MNYDVFTKRKVKEIEENTQAPEMKN